MLSKRPYFMENEEWYYHDKKKNRYVLTDKAPEKARKSYEDFYDLSNDIDPVFYYNAMQDAEKLLRQRLKNEGKTPEEIENAVSEWKNG